MISFDEAEKIVRDVPPMAATERISLSDSLFHVLAEDIIADMNMPLSTNQLWMVLHVAAKI